MGAQGTIGPVRATLAGFSAVLVGIGLARFAYTPLIPALIEARWFTPSEVVYLGAANLAGYLAGALVARPVARRLAPPRALRGMMLLATASFFACAAPLSFPWFFGWRTASGIAGGALMVLAAPTVLPHVPVGRRGLASGVIFTGVGAGIALSGTLVPLLLGAGLVTTWCGLGVLALGLTVVAWRGWPEHARPTPAATSMAMIPLRTGPALAAVYVAYGLDAAGLVPHMVFLVDFVARELGAGLVVGARYWVLVGAGATLGPIVAGRVADRFGFGPTLRWAFAIQAVAVGVVAVSPTPPILVVSSLVVGASIPGVVPLALGRIHELLAGRGDERAAWSVATIAFALCQALAAYGCSFLFSRGGTYAPLFAMAAAVLAGAFVLDVAASRLARRTR
jgi:predicted MFS family arabinose efflux permease